MPEGAAAEEATVRVCRVGRKTIRRVLAAAAVGAALAAAATPAAAGETTTKLVRPGTTVVVPDSSSRLLTADSEVNNGALAFVHATDLTNGHTYTLRWVIFNNPQFCAGPSPSGGRCGDADLTNARVQPSVVNGPTQTITGGIIEDLSNDEFFLPFFGIRTPEQQATVGTPTSSLNGVANFRARLNTGDRSRVISGPGLLNPLTAEIHIQIMEGGQVVEVAVHVQPAPGV
jgi:hypothetical protein